MKNGNKRKRFLTIMVTTLLVFILIFTGCSSSTTQPKNNAETQAPVKASLENVYQNLSNEKKYVEPKDFEVPKSEKKLKIGVAMVTLGTGFFKVLPDTIKQELEKNGAEVLIADAQGDVSKQVGQIENFLTQKVDGIIVDSADPPSALNLTLDKAAKQGVPVVAVDSFLDKNSKYLAFIGSDNYELGFQVGKYMAESLKGKTKEVKGNLAVLDGVEGNAVAKLRYDGMLAGLKSVDPNHQVKEVSHLYGGAWSEEAGIKMAENMLVANKQIDLMYGISDPFVTGGTSAAKKANRSEVIMGAVDGSKAALKIINDGVPVKAVALNDPIRMGQAGARILLSYLVTGKLPQSKVMYLNPILVTPENVKQYYNPDSPF